MATPIPVGTVIPHSTTHYSYEPYRHETFDEPEFAAFLGFVTLYRPGPETSTIGCVLINRLFDAEVSDTFSTFCTHCFVMPKLRDGVIELPRVALIHILAKHGWVDLITRVLEALHGLHSTYVDRLLDAKCGNGHTMLEYARDSDVENVYELLALILRNKYLVEI